MEKRRETVGQRVVDSIRPARKIGLLRKRKRHQHTSHDIIQFEIPFRALRVRIMATHAPLRDGPICEDGLIISTATLCHDAGIRTVHLCENFLQAGSFELVRRCIPLIDGPEAYQLKGHPLLILCH